MPSKKRDTAGLEVVSRSTYGGSQNGRGALANLTVYLFSITGDNTVERRNFLTEYHFLRDVPADYTWKPVKGAKAGDYGYTRHTETQQKFLCIGGPLNGKTSTGWDGYILFNPAVRDYKKHNRYRCVFVHESVLKG